jgi:phosphonate degradation associated HDIG domain protein
MINKISAREFSGSRDEVIGFIMTLFDVRGESMYAGEPVSQTEHALQTAVLAEQEDASSHLISAALLHDIGHLLSAHDEDCADAGIDDQHERLGSQWLGRFFGSDVVEPIRLHVPAKRYLCAVDPSYLRDLSPASMLSLELQGGPFVKAEIEAFELLPNAKDALRLRQWDEAAKIPDMKLPALEHFRETLQACLLS